MLIQIDAVIRALAALGDTTEEHVCENLATTGDELDTILVFLHCTELKRELDRQARLMYPDRKILDGDTATNIRAMLSAA